MRYAIFWGCKTTYHLPHYEAATRRVLRELAVEMVEPEFNCCGYPLRHLYFRSYLQAAARCLALAEAKGLDILTPCKCCFGSLKLARAFLADRPEMVQEVNAELAPEGLIYRGEAQIKHLLQVLHDDLGVKALKERVVRPYAGLKTAVLYGCHAIRPSRVTHFDDSAWPSFIDELVELTGARSMPWAGRLNCCGAPVRERNEELSLRIIRQRLGEARAAGAEVLVLSCPYSQMQAEWAFSLADAPARQEMILGAVLYPQLLGLSLGLPPAELALAGNTPRADYLEGFLAGAKAKAAA